MVVVVVRVHQEALILFVIIMMKIVTRIVVEVSDLEIREVALEVSMG